MATMHNDSAPRGNLIAGVFHGVGALFTSIFEGLVRIAEANSRIKEVERLNAMSDAELDARGLKRTDIVRHVFRDAMYI
ncbi:DUF1127 domain-containing protein [Antarctobacter jejuensis]|uniref:DUF1127 domain-containing protein n=1 Tax=Antarctobacter jejuensis TaxID=1439938 RepID=UPI003FD2C521